MRYMQSILYYMCNPLYLVKSLVVKFNWLFTDAMYLKIRYYLYFRKRLNLKSPKTFTEKIQWLKLYNRKPEYTIMVDKQAVKDFVKSKVGEEYIIPTLGVWNKPEEIEWDLLPNQFVLKTTHGGGGNGVVICKNKKTFNKQVAIDRLNKSLRSDIYSTLREWPYKNVTKRIIAEKYMVSKKDKNLLSSLSDYKFFCFNGRPKYCQVIRDRYSKETIDFYDMKWEHQDFVGLNPIAKFGLAPVARPNNLEKMIFICQELSKSTPFIRVDLYIVDDSIYFGELTFFPASGFGVFSPEEWNLKLGEMIKLP